MIEGAELTAIAAIALVYVLGVIGAMQMLGHFMCDKKGIGALLLFLFSVILWPVIMPVAGMSWLWLGSNSWVAWKDS